MNLYRTIANLRAHPHNYNQHPDPQVERIAASLNTFGQQRPIVIRQDGTILAGHGVVQAAEALGWSEVWVHVAPAEWTDQTAAAFLVADNETRRGAEPQNDVLAALIEESLANGVSAESMGFDSNGLEALLAEMKGDALPEPGGGGDEYEIEEDAPLRCKTGDLFLIGGKHRLVIGDCTDPAVVGRLMGGERAEAVITDPPYGIKRDKGFEGFGGFGTPIARRQYTDDWDSERPTKEALDLLLTLAPVVLIWGGNYFADILPQGKHWIVWDKNNTMPTFGDCELAWTNVSRSSVKKYEITYNGLIGKEAERYHPTQKPVKLLEAVITDYTDPDALIVDTYLGSGTTMVAAHNLGRRCFGCEIEPRYGDVILKRMEALGLTTERIEEPSCENVSLNMTVTA